MYYIIDLQQSVPTKVPGLVFQTEDDACEWIKLNGDAVKYTISKED